MNNKNRTASILELIRLTNDENQHRLDLVSTGVMSPHFPLEISIQTFVETYKLRASEVDDEINDLEAHGFFKATLIDDRFGKRYRFDLADDFNLRTNKIPDENKIVKIECVKSESNSFKVIINEDYAKALKCDKAKDSWDLFYKISEDGYFSIGEGEDVKKLRNSVNFFNTNKDCKLYSATGLMPTHILEMGSDSITPNVSIKFISEDTFNQRLKK